MPRFKTKHTTRIRAIIFDMDNTLFDFVAAKQHACREVAKFLGRDDWEALFSCFLTSPHGFESHENIKDYFDLCGLLEQCATGKNPGIPDVAENKHPGGCSISREGGSNPQVPDAQRDGRDNLTDVPTSSAHDTLTGAPSPDPGNVIRIHLSQETRTPAKILPPGTSIPEAHTGERRISVPSACAISPEKGSAPGAPAEGRPEHPAGSPTLREERSARPSNPAVRDNLLADRSLYCNEVFSRCCAIYEAEKVRVLTPYPGVRETLAELRRRGFSMAVLTDAHNGNALARLRRTDLFDFFDFIISYDMTGAKKPAPDAFLLALRKLGTQPSETLLVGDSIRRDIAPAKELGMITAYAAYGDRNIRSRDPPDCKPDYILGDIRELVGLVR